MKLSDYAQYYIGCQCFNTWFPEGHEEYSRGWKLTGFCPSIPNSFQLENNEDETWTDSIKPILRKVDSITRIEWTEIRKQLSADISMVDSVIYKDRPYWVIVLENRIRTNTLRLNDGIVLMRLGFDLFGLCEAGIAIDSKTLK